MTKAELQKYIEESRVRGVKFVLGRLSKEPGTLGYARDHLGWYYYYISDPGIVHRQYYPSEYLCINRVFERLMYIARCEGHPLKNFPRM